jgi:hypothetical protein
MNATRLTIAALLLAICTFASAPMPMRKRRGGNGDGGGDRGRTREQVEWELVPPLVQATITSTPGDGKIRAIEKETRRGATTYNAEVKQKDGMIRGIEVAANGKLISIEVASPEESD